MEGFRVGGSEATTGEMWCDATALRDERVERLQGGRYCYRAEVTFRLQETHQAFLSDFIPIYEACDFHIAKAPII